MTHICMYFQVHQPYRVRPDYHFFDIGAHHHYEDVSLNKLVIERVARQCYLPACAILLQQIRQHHGKFKISFSISGLALEQFAEYAPEVIDAFKELVDTGCVELLNETFHHSLASVFSPTEFSEQIRLHQEIIERIFGYHTKTFRNTELIYNADIAQHIEKMGFRSIISEGCENLLGWRSPNFAYMPDNCYKLNILLRNYKLSDDIAFRFSRSDWAEYPLTAKKYATWLKQEHHADIINICMDFETFGEHQNASTGIFDFIHELPAAVLQNPELTFITPNEASEHCQPIGKLNCTQTHSWADKERDLSAWLGNDLQDSACEQAYALESTVKATHDPDILRDWRRLLCSDHVYYMAKKSLSDGEVHNYFSPFATPYDAYIVFINALNDITQRCERQDTTWE